MTIFDFAIVGAGIAGTSLAAELGEAGASVLVIEAEDQPGYHATGRSAAFWEECYGGTGIVPLTLASGPYLRDHGFLGQRGALYIGRASDADEIDAFMTRFANTGATLERVGRKALAGRLPGLHEGWTEAIWEPSCADIDVASLLAHYIARARKVDVRIDYQAGLKTAERSNHIWTLQTAKGEPYKAAVLVNAAGAWADNVAIMAGARPLGIQPLRRTLVQLRTDPVPPADLPLVLDILGRFYFKPDAERLWLSPHDEEPSDPCDAAPEELAVAEAIDRFQQVLDWRVQAVERKWAGLRSFSPDRRPVYGFDPQVAGFAWFAGQGGFGIQTSPAAARLAAQILMGNDRDAMTRGLDSTLYSPSRFG